jgi:carbon storage regulator CsrA
MLVVTRNAHESVVVGEDKGLQRLMKVTVLSVLGSQVKLGFDIQDDVTVERMEDWNQLHGLVLKDRLLPLLTSDPFSHQEHRWDAVPNPGLQSLQAIAVGEFA